MTVTKEQVIISLYQTVKTLSDVLGAKDLYSGSTQHHVAQVARTIGQVMGLDTDTVDGIRIGAMLHDFGLTRIPKEILNKPGKLTEQEYEIIKQHPVHGFQILKGIDFPWPISRMILQHQERMDGTGYPGGITGDAIIVEARVIAVADVIDSMTSDRPWRKALPITSVLDELKKFRGQKYDPAVVDAAVEIYTKKIHLLEPEHYGRKV